MEKIHVLIQIVLALGILNVWIVRFKKETKYRGGSAKSLQEEFEKYGLSAKAMYAVGGLKLLIALGLLIGIFVHSVVLPCVVCLSLLMWGAIVMHIKIKDPIIKSMPASLMLAFCLVLLMSL